MTFTRYILILACMACRAGGQIPVGIIGGSPGGGGSGLVLSQTLVQGNSSLTTPAINTTGASVLVVGITSYNFPASPTDFSDSMGNTWVALNYGNSPPIGIYARMFVSFSPTVGAGHTVTCTASIFGTVFFVALGTGPTSNAISNYNGSHTYALGDIAIDNFDGNLYMSKVSSNLGNQPSTSPTQWTRQEQGAGSTSTTVQAGGAIIPPANGYLVLSLLSSAINSGTISVNSGLTIINSINGGGSDQGGGIAYLVQPTAASINPTWSSTGAASSMAVSTAMFKD